MRKKGNPNNHSDIVIKLAERLNTTTDKAETIVSKAAMCVNMAYALADTQDSLLREADSLLLACYQCATHDSRMRFKRIKKNIESALYPLKEEAKNWNTSGGNQKEDEEMKRFIEGLSDLYYDVVRMLFDRMAKKKDVIHMIHLLRTIPNHNHYFPELDKGRYTIL